MQLTALDSEVIQNAVTSACRAPSLHNSQPWQWAATDCRIRLYLDPSRVMDADQSAREALISCGAALDHLRVAMAAAGWQSHIERFPNPDHPDHLATIEFDPIAYVTARDRARAQAVWARRTDRLPFHPPRDWKSIAAVWAEETGHTVHVESIPESLLPKLAEAAQLAESLRLYDGAYHGELQWWTAPFEKTEGIPHSSLVSAAESDRVGLERVFPVVRRLERRTEIPEDQAMVLLLSTDDDDRARRFALRGGAFGDVAGLHHGRPRHLPGDASHRAAGDPRGAPFADGPRRRAASPGAGRRCAGDREDAGAHTAPTAVGSFTPKVD